VFTTPTEPIHDFFTLAGYPHRRRWIEMMNGYGGGGAVWMFLMAGFWVALIVGVVVLIRGLGAGGERTAATSGAPGASPETALQILKRRYARGDVDRSEYLEKVADLTPRARPEEGEP
jgi:putative membrane protein